MNEFDGLGRGNCLLCRHCLANAESTWCGVYAIWIDSPKLVGMDCPSFEEDL